MINREDVQHIAKLARLGLSEKEIEKMGKELSAILAHFEKLKKVDTENVKPMSHSVLVENVMRSEEEKSENQEQKRTKKLLDLIPETKDGYLKVKSIF